MPPNSLRGYCSAFHTQNLWRKEESYTWNFVATDWNPGVLVQSIIVKPEIIFLTFESVWIAGCISADDLFMNPRKKYYLWLQIWDKL